MHSSQLTTRLPKWPIPSQRRKWLTLFVTAGSLMAMLLIGARSSNPQGQPLPKPTIIPDRLIGQDGRTRVDGTPYPMSVGSCRLTSCTGVSIPTVGVLRGVITTSNGQPIFEAMIGCSPLTLGVVGDAMAIGTDKQGYYETRLQPGRYRVGVYADHHASQDKEVEVRANQAVQLDFKLIPD